MIEAIRDGLAKWNQHTSDRQKLQHTYLYSAVIFLLVAGVVGLINYALGQNLLLLALIALAVCLCNAVVWALLQSFVLLRIAAPATTTRRRPGRPAGSTNKATKAAKTRTAAARTSRTSRAATSK